MDSHRKGTLTEAIVLAELLKREIPVSIPFGDNERYDFVVETPDGGFLRLQVKTGWLTDGVVEFHTKSQHTNASGNTYDHYGDSIDYFAVYVHELKSLYLVSPDDFDSRITLRVKPPKKPDPRTNWAEEFVFDSRWPPRE